MKTSKFIGAALALMISLVFVASHANAASSTTDPTTVYTNSSSPAATAVGAAITQEVGADSFVDGYFTVTIPSDVNLSNIGSSTSVAGESITKSTTVLGSSTSPKALYFLARADSGVVFFNYGATQMGILRVWESAAIDNFVYGTDTGGPFVPVSDWATASSTFEVSSGSTSVKIGQIYTDGTSTYISLAGKGKDSSNSESMYLDGLMLKPSATNITGTVNLTLADGKADGTGGIGVTTDTGVKVMTIVSQPASVSGTTAPSTVPNVLAGAVAAQPIGKFKVTFVGTPTSTASSTIVFTLNNNAKFHTSAASPSTNSFLDYDTTSASFGDSDFAVNASGQLVLTVSNPSQCADTSYIQFSSSGTDAMLDANSISAASAITMTVSGTGTYSALNQDVLVGNSAVSGVSLSYVGTTDTLYTGRNDQEFSSTDYVLVGEDAPTSLLQGGSIIMTLNSGAKFQTSATVAIADTTYTTSPYTNTAFQVSSDADTSASTSLSITVDSASSGTRGAFTVGKGGTNWLDLTGATAGDLTMTFSGTAGASGVVTIATIMDATDTTVASTPTFVPGTTNSLPDITVTENKATAINAGYFGLKLPSTWSMDTTATPTVTTTDAAGTSSTTWVKYDSYDSTNKVIMFQVATASNSTAGAYTIVISGLSATLTSSAGTSDTDITIAGSTAASYDSAAFGSNYGAKVTSEAVTVSNVVSATLPFADTATVAGTMVTQTFIAAGNDIGKVGDLYVFTDDNQYYDGSTWSTTEATYSDAATLGTHTITYDTDGLVTGTNIFIGYGVGLSGTAATMSSNGTFVTAYTTPATVSVGTDAGANLDAEANVDDDIELYLNITNDDGYDPAADFVYEWLVFGATVNGVDAGLFFYTNDPTAASAVVAYDATLDLSTVAYTFDHSVDSFKVTDLNMGTLGQAAGDQFWYGYVYGLTGFDLADTTTWNLENYTFITAK